MHQKPVDNLRLLRWSRDQEKWEEVVETLTLKGSLRRLTIDFCWREPNSWWTNLHKTVAMRVSKYVTGEYVASRIPKELKDGGLVLTCRF